MENDYSPCDAVARTSDGRCRDLYGVLVFAVSTDHNRAPSHIDASSHCQAALDRVAQRPAISIIDQRKQLADTVSGGGVPIGAGQRLSGEVHVINVPIGVGCNDAFGN
jgi:hypothetical protein